MSGEIWKAAYRLGLCMLLLGFGAAAAGDEVYRVVDEDGNVTYTDQPPQDGDGEEVELEEPNRLPSTDIRSRPDGADDDSDPETPEYRIRISHPPDEHHLTAGERNLTVDFSVEPSLAPGHRVEITDNGEPIDGRELRNIVVRGTHLLRARVLDESGQVLAESEPVRFYVHRPSRN